MRWHVLHAALFSAAVMSFVFALVTPASAGPVEISNACFLTANVVAELGAGDAGDRQEAQDTADLAKHAVSAHAEAQVDTVTTSGSVVADLLANENGFELTGSASTNLPVDNSLQANTTAVNNTLVPFTLIDGWTARIDYDIDINAMVKSDQKVTLEIRRDGQAGWFRHIFTESAASSIEIDPGSYQLLAVTGSLSTAKGIAGESGSADYRVSVNAIEIEPPPAAIPLPAAVWPGAITLGLALLGSKWPRT